TPERPIKAGYKGAIWKVRDEYGRPRAAKLAIVEDYEDRSYLEEFERAAKLERYREFAKLDGCGLTDIAFPARTLKFVCFVEEWIDGDSLDDFVDRHRSEITVAFFLWYVEHMARALQALVQERLRHDDLHFGNVMITAPTGTGVLAERELKIVDNGSLKPSDDSTKKDRDDLQNFVEHLVRLWNVIFTRQPLSAPDRRFLIEAEGLLATILETDPAVALRDPTQILERFREAHTRARQSPHAPSDTLRSPFEFPSAEHIADDRVLVGIFAKSCPWLPKVAGRDPCLVTGPR